MPSTLLLHPWHAIRTRYNHEHRVNAALTAPPFSLPTYFPTYDAVWTYKGRRRAITLPHLYSTVLARFPAADPHLWHAINDIPPVLGFLGGAVPLSIPDREIIRFQDHLDMRSLTEFLPSTHIFRPGDSIIFVGGPWKTYGGTVTYGEPFHPYLRVKILGLLGRDQEVPCSASWCEPAERPLENMPRSVSSRRRERARKARTRYLEVSPP